MIIKLNVLVFGKTLESETEQNSTVIINDKVEMVEESEDISDDREERLFFNRRPARLNPAAALLIPAIPTFVGLGAGLAWIASLRVPITTSISNIGSPTTNVTVSQTNQECSIKIYKILNFYSSEQSHHHPDSECDQHSNQHQH